MLHLDLMILFNGFIKNYTNFGLTKCSKSIDVIKQENKYFSTMGKLLGFTVVDKINTKGIINEICWSKDEFNIQSKASIKLKLFREVDLTKDLLAIDTVLNEIKENTECRYICIIEISSYNRIDFLNNIISKSVTSSKAEYLVIYIIRNVIDNITYFNSFLFKGNKIIKNKIGASYIDKEGNLSANFKFSNL